MEHEPMGLDELVSLTAMLPVDLLQEPLELLVGRSDRSLEARRLGVPIVPKDPPLGDHHPHLQEMRGTDGDPA
jgi:hypothetical protein